ncbi:MAG: helix-turn-helix domain-containing protein [Chitinophagaceae bacterium]|nr:helix-turn-helix domain-containing protein [Chitinophagaceae bacterium]MCA6460585.1 helix-turn-helix domain-containing protein [Chitinophagaceae bacterium]MCA6464069.1 helix-turn-helix domain-containing protein [Chitinophagaceae bacterium]
MSKEIKKVLIEVDELTGIIQNIIKNEIESCFESNRFGKEFADEIWSRKEVAEFLDITPEKVSDWVKQGKIPFKQFGREYKFKKSEIVGLFKMKNR